MEEMMQGEEQGVAAILQQVIALHASHIDGSVQTTPESQQEMMELLERALVAAGGEQDEGTEDEQIMAGYGKMKPKGNNKMPLNRVFGE